MTLQRFAATVAGILLSTVVHATQCSAQSLHGSKASVRRMYRQARAEKLSFYETPRGVRKAVASGRLVRLVPDVNFSLHQVGYPYVRPATLTFVERLGAQYQAACGEQLEVTSAVRPATRQPPNSVARSVHPTGMAVDLHKSDDPQCRRWLRKSLLELEDAGLLEATEEFAPPHFHVAVFPSVYARYVARQTRAASTTRLASANNQDGSAADDDDTYTVRSGDTLWDIAHAHGVSVEAITAANGLDDAVIQPGQELVIPERD
jgi:LysM repeat protein